MKLDNFKSKVNANGRIVIPAEIRKSMGLKAGDALVMTLVAGVLQIQSQQARVRGVQESLRQRIPGRRVLSEELMTDRREEASREIEEWLG